MLARQRQRALGQRPRILVLAEQPLARALDPPAHPQ
jgi:hypothetical protein